MDMPKQKPVLLKQGSSINVGAPELTKQKTIELQRKKMLEPKIHKGSYVKKKNLDIDYENPVVSVRNIDVKYDVVSLVNRINNFNAFDSKTASWLIDELKNKKSQLPPKAQNILGLNVSLEATMRLLNLKNCVSIPLTFSSLQTSHFQSQTT